MIVLYVDDLLLTGNNHKWIDWFQKQLEQKFEMSESGNGDVTLYLKAEYVQVREGIFMSQRGYAHQILECFDMLECQPLATPMVERPRLEPDMGEEEVDSTFYRKIVGNLIHLTYTRPDLSYCVGTVSIHVKASTLTSFELAKES